MPEAGHPPLLHYAATPRRRRSGFRRHRTYCRSVKWCCQSVVMRLRRLECPPIPRPQQAQTQLRDGYLFADAAVCCTWLHSRSTRRGLRRINGRRHTRSAIAGSLDHGYLLPQCTSNTLWAPLKRRSPQRTPAAAPRPAAAAPRRRNARRALRDQRRFRPMRTTSSAARTGRR